MDFGSVAGILNPTQAIAAGMGVADDAFKLYQQRRGEAFQEQFAKEGLRWRVADAEAAGLSPVYGAGLAGAVGTPIPIMQTSLGEMGQNISRAALAGATTEEKEGAVLRNAYIQSQIKSEDMRAEGLALQNEKLRRELSAQPGPPSIFGGDKGGVSGSGPVVVESQQFSPLLRGGVKVEAPKVPAASDESRAVIAGQRPMWQKVRLDDGTEVYLPDAGEGQTFMGNSPITGMALAIPQWLYQQTLNLGDLVSERGKSDRAAFRRWWNDKSVYDPNSSYWKGR